MAGRDARFALQHKLYPLFLLKPHVSSIIQYIPALARRAEKKTFHVLSIRRVAIIEHVELHCVDIAREAGKAFWTLMCDPRCFRGKYPALSPSSAKTVGVLNAHLGPTF